MSENSNDTVLARLKDAALRVVQAVPECVALSVSHFDNDVTFTLVVSSDEFRVIDAAQYLGRPLRIGGGWRRRYRSE
jgi:hypothetical protein